MMKEELRFATWESVDIVQNLLPHDKKVATKVHNTVRSVDRNWPKTAKEKDYYSTFSRLLNKTLRAARTALGKGSSAHHKSLTFSEYDRVTEDGVDGAHELKPDIVSCDQEIARSEKVPWHAIRIPVEVKKSWPDTVAQAATYARCMFAAYSGRQYALVIALNHISTEVRFLFFHRGGLTASPAFKLKHNDGWMHFVSAMVGLASVKDRFSFGMDHSFDNSQIALPLGGRWKADGWLFIGNCIRGRATQVVRVSRISQAEKPKTASIKHRLRSNKSREQSGPITRSMTQARLHVPVVALPEYHSARRIKQMEVEAASGSSATAEVVNRQKVVGRPEFDFAGTSEQASGSRQKVANNRATTKADSNTNPKAEIERIQRKPENNALKCLNEMLNLHSEDIPLNLVVKDSWPLVGRNNETAMYQAAQGLFGVPEVLTSYEVKGPDRDSHLTKRFLPATKKYWDIWQYPASAEAATGPVPEDRVQIRHLFKTEGRNLLDATSPHELLEGILHAMIGYLNYYETGYMHRDVSVGNVLLLKQRLIRPAFTHIDVVSDKTECIGVLTDGDHAINWRDDHVQSAHRSGTLPFMSLRLVDIWLFRKPYYHTTIDDLESFLWLTVWCILCIIEDKGKLGKQEAFSLQILRSTSIGAHAGSKKNALDRLADADEDENARSLLALFQPLLLQWRSISNAGAQEISKFLKSTTSPENDALRDLTHRYFREYLTQGFSDLANFPQSWEPYFPSEE